VNEKRNIRTFEEKGGRERGGRNLEGAAFFIEFRIESHQFRDQFSRKVLIDFRFR